MSRNEVSHSKTDTPQSYQTINSSSAVNSSASISTIPSSSIHHGLTTHTSGKKTHSRNSWLLNLAAAFLFR